MYSRYEKFATVIPALYRCMQRIERDEMVKYGYKGAYAQYLAAIARYPEGVTATQLCEICEKDKAAVSRVLAEMIQCGLVEREDMRNYRARLFLTPEGQRLANVVRDRATAAVHAVDQGLSSADRETFYSVLKLISDNLYRIGREGIPENREP